ncbi:hypothetical protein ACNI3Q_11795 [Sphingomonas sp. FW199]|uniref:hypothetical protein n=1 Tax=Sphingomonas sp. FW199 TaxID=3400217 RepID=UPI003CF78491
MHRDAARPALDWPFILVVIGVGIALRLAWFTVAEGNLLNFIGAGEATRVALSLARTGQFADAFYAGYGHTAHLTPISPAIAAGVMMLLGVDTAASNIALLCWSLGQVILGWVLMLALFRRLGVDGAARRWGIGILAMVPVFMGDEVIVFRFWEGALTLALVVTNLILVHDLTGRGNPGWLRLAGIAALTAFTFFLCPPAGLAIDLCWAIWAFRTLSLPRIAGFAAMSAGALGLIVLPWAMRNAAVMGEPVLLRSNAGLELAIANHPAALSGRPNGEVYFERLLAVQPYFSVPARQKIRDAGGEVAYARGLGRQAMRWIADHPAGFAQLFLRHLRQFFFPESWQLMFGLPGLRAGIMGVVSAIGLAGLAAGLWQRRAGYGMLAVYLGTVALPYAVVQPVQRYSYLVYGLLVMLAADALVRLARWALARYRAPTIPMPVAA